MRWSVLDGVDGEGLLVQPFSSPVGHLVVLPDVTQTPEQVMGLAPNAGGDEHFARHLAELGFELVIPTLVNREPLQTDDKRTQQSEQTNREWLYRQAYHMGRHVIGYEVQKVLAAIDWQRQQHGPQAKVGVVGYGEGGMLAFYAAAIDPRIDLALVSGYFDNRQKVWAEPIDRNVWSLLERFGDAEIASLILPRHLIIERASVPEFTSKKGDLPILMPTIESVKAEFDRIPSAKDLVKAPSLIVDKVRPPKRPVSADAPGEIKRPVFPGAFVEIKRTPLSPDALGEIWERWALKATNSVFNEFTQDRRRGFDPQERQLRTIRQIEQHVQSILQWSEHVRDQRFLFKVLPELEKQAWSNKKEHPVLLAEHFVTEAKPFREEFLRDGMGKFDVPYLPLNPRSRKILETDRWTAWDVVLDVWPDVFAWGVLVLPKDIKPGEQRPVVVCQHGRRGVPLDTINRQVPAYNDFAAKLAERGFITFAPHNLYRGEDRYRWLNRKANNVHATLFSFIIGQHEQILTWLETLPMVDSKRIAFYGLSYGGETAVRVPTVLEKYCLSICSGDFNQWTRKVAATDQPFSFMRTIEWEMPYWNLGSTFDYAEMTYLMVPRPFMIERGHLDLVGRDQWVAHEYGKVKYLYAQLGLADRTEIEYFQGGHSINGKGTFAFCTSTFSGRKSKRNEE